MYFRRQFPSLEHAVDGKTVKHAEADGQRLRGWTKTFGRIQSIRSPGVENMTIGEPETLDWDTQLWIHKLMTKYGDYGVHLIML